MADWLTGWMAYVSLDVAKASCIIITKTKLLTSVTH